MTGASAVSSSAGPSKLAIKISGELCLGKRQRPFALGVEVGAHVSSTCDALKP
jgi:hypothetical protein